MATEQLSGRVAVLMRAAAEQVLAFPPEVFEQIDAASLAEHDAGVAADPVLLASFRRANRETIRHWARSVREHPAAEVPPYLGAEALGLARDLVRRGFDARALEPYRAGQNAAWQQWMEIAFTLTGDAAELRELLRVSARSIFAYVDATNAATVEMIGRERSDLTRGTNAERLELITLVLEGSPLDLRRAALRLGHDFDRTHLAAIIWTAATGRPATGHAAELDRATELLAAAAHARHPLTVTASEAVRWVWIARPRLDGLGGLAQAVAELPDTRIALGSPRHGIEGFRQSHSDAFATQGVLVRLGSDARVARYEQVQALTLAAQDETRALSFARETLGELADAPAALRDSLRTYLRLQSNATRTAAALYAHRNTIVSRIARAQELLPQPLAQRAFEVCLALEILHWSGDATPG